MAALSYDRDQAVIKSIRIVLRLYSTGRNISRAHNVHLLQVSLDGGTESLFPGLLKTGVRSETPPKNVTG